MEVEEEEEEEEEEELGDVRCNFGWVSRVVSAERGWSWRRR